MPRGTRTDRVSIAPTQEDGTQHPQLSVTPALFRKFQHLLHTETGIWLGNTKTALLSGRLFRRLLSLGISSLEEYYEIVAAPEGADERVRMIDAITTNETRFFREPRQFDFLVQQVFPQWSADAEQGLRQKRIRIWSAGCSSGEEPYTLAMLLARYLPSTTGWDSRILATDISSRMLERAQKGIYDIARSVEVPKDLLHKFMLRGFADQQGRVKMKVEMQEMIEFRRLNLSQGPYAIEGPYDLILCRNVLIYFNSESRQKAVANLIDQLAPSGYLFVGHAENLTSLSAQLRSVEPTIYIKKTGEASQSNLHAPERGKAIGTSASR